MSRTKVVHEPQTQHVKMGLGHEKYNTGLIRPEKLNHTSFFLSILEQVIEF